MGVREPVPPNVVFVGGPVQPGGVIGLAEVTTPSVGADRRVSPSLWPGLGTVDLEAEPST